MSSEAIVLDDDLLCLDCWETGEAEVEVGEPEVVEDSAQLTVTCDGCGAEVAT